MPGALRVEVLNLTTIASIESLGAQRSLFTHIGTFYKTVGAPEGPGAGQNFDSWLGPLVDHVRGGGAIDFPDARPLQRFYISLVKYLATGKAALSPLPISHVTLRIETVSPADSMPKEVSGTSEWFAALFQKPPQLITGNFGKTKRIVKTAGNPTQRAEVSAWAYSKSVLPLAVGDSWQVTTTT